MNDLIIYSMAEINAMLAARKCLGTVDWEVSEYDLPQVRDTPGERSVKWPVFPRDRETGMMFQIEPRYSDEGKGFGITLHGNINGNGWQALCRYDMHTTVHSNKPFCPGGAIEVPEGAMHVHTYNEKAMRKTGRWWACAELLLSPCPIPSPAERRMYLKRSFLEKLNVDLVDPDAYRALMEFDRE